MKKRNQFDQLNTVLTPRKSASNLLRQNGLNPSHISKDLKQSLSFEKYIFRFWQTTVKFQILLYFVSQST